ncbi:MAG TPA: TIGR03960 family B12-binding radical SAM protein [Polyangiaceae bacterium]|nr:TIGR03960 family B12-binding radical SAM protein [Polyangiaceae bacterium]
MTREPEEDRLDTALVVTKAPGEHPYASFVHLVQKPARYLGGEFGARVKDWQAVEAKVCLAFPDVYDIGMSHLGFKILYKLLSDDPSTLAERAYAPWPDMEAQLRARGLPLVSCESARPLRDFDVVGFSLQFELTYTNVLLMLDLGGIPLRAEARGEADPLVIAGGPTATHPEPLAPFVDAVVIGDGEERTGEVALSWVRAKRAGAPRAERLRRLASLQGVYVPSLYSTVVDPTTGFTVVGGRAAPEAPLPVRRTLVDDLNRFPFPDDGPIGGPEAIFDRMSIEVARGCTEGCRFCQAGMIYRPVRERDPEQIVRAVTNAIKKSGYDEVSLTSLSTADYSCIAPLVKKVSDALTPKRVSLGVSSLRAYGLDENVLDDMARVRATGVTFAPEAGTQRMRDVINKNVTEEQLLETAERVFSRGWQSMKLYFMIGLPTETEEDVRAIPQVGGRARQIGKTVKRQLGSGGAPKVTVSVSTHVPKPHTPFQWCAMDAPEIVRRKQQWLDDEARRAGVELRVHDCDTSWLEAVFARGDRSLAAVLERAYRAGARFDSWEDQKKIGVWEDAFRAEGIDVGRYLGTIPVSARLPWDHVDVGLEEGFLVREYRKALADRLSPPCGKAVGAFVHATNVQDASADERKLVCYDCGIACDLSAMREQRLVYLRTLGAEQPRAPVPADPAADVEARAGRRPRASVQGAPIRYRFLYEKIGTAAFLSHLDVIRALPRAFRRLELPLWYSQGFHPKPDMTFGPALSLGVASLSEAFDVKLSADVDPAALLDELTSGAQPGLRFVGGVRLGPQDLAITRVLDAARYVVGIPRRSMDELGGEHGIRARIDSSLQRREMVVIRRIEGIGKRVDVREFLRTVRLAGDDGSAALSRAGIAGDLIGLSVEVELRGSGGVKIAEVVEALFDDAQFPHRAVRIALGRRTEGQTLISPLELEKLRPSQTPGTHATSAELQAADSP